MREFRRFLFVMTIIAIAGAIWYLETKKPPRVTPQEAEIPSPHATMGSEEKTKQYPRAKELVNPQGYINIDRITIGEHIGKKVVLVDFWTYTCINCQRTIPYLNAWWQKYKDKGLMMIGVHTPEFAFEKKYENVLAAVKKFGVQYPVVQDNDYATWNAYKNRWWPHKYLIDIDGFIVYDHIGEGAYAETEKKIQELLTERMQRLGEQGTLDTDIAQPAEAPEAPRVGSPEIYFGSARNEHLGNGKAFVRGPQTFIDPPTTTLNTLYLVGDWNMQSEFAENVSAGAKIIFRYRSKRVFLVGSSEEGVRVKVLRDGNPIGAEAGEDVGSDSTVVIQEDRLYKLIEDSTFGEHTLELVIETPGFRAFTFTFG